MTNPRLAGALLAGTLALGSCRGPAPRQTPSTADAAPLHRAVHALSSVIVYDIFSPPQASRVYAYTSIAAYEVMRQGDSRYRSLAGQLPGLQSIPTPPAAQDISLTLAGVHAFMAVGRALTFSQARMDSLRGAMDAELSAPLSADVAERSIAYGDVVAKHILAWAGGDHYKESRGMPKYSVNADTGRWIPTPPAYTDAVEPNWRVIRPFTLDSASQFRPEPPHPFDLRPASPFYRELREVYETGRALSEEQRAIASFWDCNPYVMHVQGHTMFATKKITPGGHWMGIVGILTRKANFGTARTAETYARTAIALADGFISVWEEKYYSNFIRPETVINKYVDDSWAPLLQTPPFPEYTSGHSVITTAAASVLTQQFGENFAFADSSEVEFGMPVRSFPSINAAAAEAAISRLYGGIHFRRAIEQGQAEGRRVGQQVVQRLQTHGEAPLATQPATGTPASTTPARATP